MSIGENTQLSGKEVLTPRGIARVVWSGMSAYGYHLVKVRFVDTGSPWTFERRQVEVL